MAKGVRMRRIVVWSVLFLGLMVNPLSLQASEEIAIWKGEAPGTQGRVNHEEVVNERVRNVHQPSLTIHLPPRELATGTAILVCPGGGYRHLAIQKEGHQIAAWLNTLGVAAYVLKYRLDRDEALQDAQESIRLIRRRSKEWSVESSQVGVMGFSAGAHLIVNLTMSSSVASRPDFIVPAYFSQKGLDLEKFNSENVRPAFIVGATDDKATPPAMAIALYQKLLSQRVPVELHLFEKGGHGFGLAKTRGAVASWTKLCEDWMRGRGLLEVASQGR